MAFWSVEAWRGVAALLVVWAHWAAPLQVQGGFGLFAFTGVDIFFVVSGFVFAPYVLGQVQIRLAGYALRRVLRIYPAYLVALALYAVLAWLQGRSLLYLPEHVLMVHLQSREMAFYYNPPFWSLPAEVQFYALIPVFAWLVGRAQWLFWPLLFAGAVALRLALLPVVDGTTQNWAYLALHHVPGMLIEFFLGVWAWQRVQADDAPWRAGWVVLGASVCLGATTLYLWIEGLPGRAGWFNGQLGFCVAAGFAFMLVGSARWAPRPGWGFDAGVWAGRLSYGTYLLHMAWLGLLTWLNSRQVLPVGWVMTLGLLLTGLSAWAMYHWVEDPARRWGRRWMGQ